jgi:hypothetical protein
MDSVARLTQKFKTTDGCWPWTAAKVHNGYGVFWLNNRLNYAHRVVYEWLVGPIPPGLEIDHLCRNRGCVRPSHLEPVTHQENDRRGAAARPKKPNCLRGHAYSDYGFIDTQGHRQCRLCHRARNRKYKAKLRASRP